VLAGGTVPGPGTALGPEGDIAPDLGLGRVPVPVLEPGIVPVLEPGIVPVLEPGIVPVLAGGTVRVRGIVLGPEGGIAPGE